MGNSQVALSKPECTYISAKKVKQEKKKTNGKKRTKNKQPNKKRWIPTVCLNHMMLLDKSREAEAKSIITAWKSGAKNLIV